MNQQAWKPWKKKKKKALIPTTLWLLDFLWHSYKTFRLYPFLSTGKFKCSFPNFVQWCFLFGNLSPGQKIFVTGMFYPSSWCWATYAGDRSNWKKNCDFSAGLVTFTWKGHTNLLSNVTYGTVCDDPLLKNRSHPGSMENQESHLFFRESCNYEATELISASLFLFISNTLSLHLSLSAQSNNGTSREQESPYNCL